MTPSSEVTEAFPFNQFPQRVGSKMNCSQFFVLCMLLFPFNQFPQRVGSIKFSDQETFNSAQRFHSISFPNEWGELTLKELIRLHYLLFPFNQFPQRVGSQKPSTSCTVSEGMVSIQLVSPTSGEMNPMFHTCQRAYRIQGFHSISFPNEWGVSLYSERCC